VLILGIDTSGRQGSVALLRAQGAELVPLGLSAISGGQYSELLLSSIAGLLACHGFQKSSIGLVGVASGPGSFTGLRIAIATVKGLAEAFAIPVVAVSVLEAIADASGAEGTGAEGRVIAAMDAQRSEVFWGEYNLESAAQSATQSAAQSEPPEPVGLKVVPELAPRTATMLSESLASFVDFTSQFASALPNQSPQNQAPQKVFTPDEALAARLREANVDVSMLARPSAEAFARIAYRRFLAGVRADVATLDANYLRRSDAEILPALKSGGEPR
jgi:tRNA threonylcarbamoyladenosine biosynthesis protein TsaB